MLSETARTILGLVAEGRSYDQILQQRPELTYFDIFAAAREALELAGTAPLAPDLDERTLPEPAVIPGLPFNEAPPAEVTPLLVPVPASPPPEDGSGPAESPPRRLPSYIERARATHRRAWARWTREEDARLTSLFQQGDSRAELVEALGRQPGAIRSRLLKLGLISETEGDDATLTNLDSGQDAQGPNLVLELTSRDDRPEREHASPTVPGWESFRDRLTDESPGT